MSPTYNYDTLARVTKLSPSGGGSTSYGYDLSGNLTTLPGGPYSGDTGTYDDASELTSIGASGGSVSLAYDADGERLSSTQGSSTLTSGIWNGAGELTSYDVTGGADMSAAGYDGLGLRESDTVGSVTNHFVWDTSASTPRLLEDHANLYIYGPSGTPIEQMGLSGGTRKYLVPDALGSVRAVVNSSGTVLGNVSYDAYGTPTGTGVSSNSPFGFAGGYTDATGLVYLVHRYYDPQTGQFLSVDPLVDVTGQPYAYVIGNPVSRTDPTGLDEMWEEQGGGNGAGGPDGTGSAAGAGAGSISDGSGPGGGAVTDGGWVQIWTSPDGSTEWLNTETGERFIQAPSSLTQGQLFNAEDLERGQACASTGVSEAEGLSPSQLRAINSLEQQITVHEAKLAAYIENPDAYDNQNLLRNAPSDEIRQRIISGRIAHLQAEIRAFQGAIERIQSGG